MWLLTCLYYIPKLLQQHFPIQQWTLVSHQEIRREHLHSPKIFPAKNSKHWMAWYHNKYQLMTQQMKSHDVRKSTRGHLLHLPDTTPANELWMWSTSGSYPPVDFLRSGRGESSFGSSRPNHGMGLLPQIENKKFLHSGMGNPPLDLACLSVEGVFSPI